LEEGFFERDFQQPFALPKLPQFGPNSPGKARIAQKSPPVD
jgi:hypothetical protein